jgi:hypothetical protein
MWFGILTLFTALIISISAAYYSILGLTAIFVAAFWPIVILGSSLEVGKIVSTLWLHKYWDRAEVQYKIYLCSAVAILMLLTSMGVFGFLSKAHLDQEVPAGDIQAQVQIFDDKIQTQQDNIKTARTALAQMDSQVDQMLGRSSDEKGAERAVQIRRNQSRERTALQNEIARAQKEITALQEQRAPVKSQARVLEAEVGPIKYIAALIYGDNPEANVLEKAVRWVIILIVIVFDPLALTLLLAATKSIEWERAGRRRKPEYEPDDGPLTGQQITQLKEQARADLPTGQIIAKDSLFADTQVSEFFERARQRARDIDAGQYEPPDPEPKSKRTILPGLDALLTRAKNPAVTDTEAEHAPLPAADDFVDDIDDDSELTEEKMAERAWKSAHPHDTLKHQRHLFDTGVITQLPWHHQEFQNTILPASDLQADNVPPGSKGEVRGFGTAFPATAAKGDMFLRVDQLPSVLYKFNGKIWIEVDKALSDNHAWDDAYIDHLIMKIGTGEYDPDLLSDAERDRIEARLLLDTHEDAK